MLFRTPPRTPYDLNFTLFGFDVRVHPLFWLMAFIFGASLNNILDLITWVIVVFISILLHELGHAVAGRMYGENPFIVLYLGGGLAVSPVARRTTTQQIIISLAGPVAGFLLGALVIGIVFAAGGIVYTTPVFEIIPMPVAFLPGNNGLNSVIWIVLWVNMFWGVINLMPVFPLDGGQVARAIFVKLDPWNGIRNSLWLSVIAGVLMAIAGFIYLDSLYIAFLFGLMALQSYQQI